MKSGNHEREERHITAFMPEEGGFKIEASTADCVLTSLKG